MAGLDAVFVMQTAPVTAAYPATDSFVKAVASRCLASQLVAQHVQAASLACHLKVLESEISASDNVKERPVPRPFSLPPSLWNGPQTN